MIGAFVWTRTRVAGGRRVIAVDGKTVRGARTATTAAPHLVSAYDHVSGTVLGQLATAAKSNEIPAVRTLLSGLDLTDVVVTVDAMHTQTDTATAITGVGGDYVFSVKANQPGLYAACKRLPWRDVAPYTSVSTGHGRRVLRTIKVVAAPAWITFAAAAQVAQIRRTTTRAGSKTVEVVYVITSADCRAAPPAVLAAWVQCHWRIENRAHWTRRRLRRGPLPGPHRQRTPGNGHPAQHRHQPAPAIRSHQHRRSPATSRRPHRTTDRTAPDLMNQDFASALAIIVLGTVAYSIFYGLVISPIATPIELHNENRVSVQDERIISAGITATAYYVTDNYHVGKPCSKAAERCRPGQAGLPARSGQCQGLAPDQRQSGATGGNMAGLNRTPETVPYAGLMPFGLESFPVGVALHH